MIRDQNATVAPANSNAESACHSTSAPYHGTGS